MTKYKHIIVPVLTLIIGLTLGFSVAMTSQSHRNEYKKDFDKGMMHHSMKDMMDDMNMGLADKTGKEFDKAFIDEMIVHHQGAIDMANLVLQKSDRPELKKLAQDIITAQSSEIKTMSGWKAEWFK